MSIAEGVEQLRDLASSEDIPMGLLRQADIALDGVIERANQILGGLTDANTVAGIANEAKQQLEGAMAAVRQLEQTLHDVADRHAS